MNSYNSTVVVLIWLHYTVNCRKGTTTINGTFVEIKENEYSEQ